MPRLLHSRNTQPGKVISITHQVFSDVPLQTLDRLLQYTNSYWEEFNQPSFIMTAADSFVFVDTKDITDTSKMKVIASPPANFSPKAFIGNTIEQVREWFDAKITQTRHKEFMRHCFLVLDKQTTEDETCIFFCTQDAPLQWLRCHFDIAYENANNCDQGQAIEEGTMGRFMRSGIIMTKANEKLVSNGGLYIEGGEVKLDEYWRYLGEE